MDEAPEMCENCGMSPKFGQSEYCSRACKTEYERKGLDKPAARAPTQIEYPCEECGELPRAQRREPSGSTVIYPYCGQTICTKLPSVPPVSVSSIPTPAAVGHSDSISIQPEDPRDPVVKTVLHNMESRWASGDTRLKEIKAVYRLDLSASIYRRFDTALQMNISSTVITSYYGARNACGIGSDGVAPKNPCTMDSCAMCTVIRSAFASYVYGNASHHGVYGPGIYTYTNPALAHRATAPIRHENAENRAIIQCRVVTREYIGAGETFSYAGSVDESGMVFCAQAAAIIPTHLVVYSANSMKQDSQSQSTTGNPETHNNPPDPSSYTLQPSVKQITFSHESGPFFELSNYAPYPVTYRGKVYPTAEHLFQARKFLDHRPLIAEHIRRGSEQPHFATEAAPRWAPESRPDWREKRVEIMEEIIELKFTQHETLRSLLLNTGDRILIYSSGTSDDFWGEGARGTGQNEMGRALMRIRDKLRREFEAAVADAIREAREAATRRKGKGRR